LSPPDRKNAGSRDRADGLRRRRPFLKTSVTIRKKIVAVVDDDAGIRTAAAKLLSAFGFGTETFASAEAFLNVLATTEAACLVIDIQLGGMSGLDLARQLVLDGFKRPFIFLTALDDEAVRSAAMAAGGLACLHKPFAAQTLIEAVIKAMG
jgi:FixJ family two-component response regulator